MNKFILKISLLNNEECTLVIDIVQWDRRFISNNYIDNPKPNFCYFQDSQEFTLYSQNEGQIIDDYCLEVPEYKHMVDSTGKFMGAKLIHDFYNDDRRFLYLKGLYRCLSEWAIDWTQFKEDVESTNKIILSRDYWIK